MSWTHVPWEASASNSVEGVSRSEAISSMKAPVPPAHVPFMRMSDTSTSPVAGSVWKKTTLAS